MHPLSIFVIELLLHEVVDLTTPGQLDAWGLTAQDLISGDLQRCQEVAGVAARLGAEAIRWPSATGAGQSVAVFIDQLRPGSHADAVRSFDLTHDALKAIAAGASVVALIPALKDTTLFE
jgi:hypothetical protein